MPAIWVAARVMTEPMALPSVSEATAMVVTMMPRISAYSAAEAPDSSRPKAFRRLIIIVTPFKPIRRGSG